MYHVYLSIYKPAQQTHRGWPRQNHPTLLSLLAPVDNGGKGTVLWHNTYIHIKAKHCTLIYPWPFTMRWMRLLQNCLMDKKENTAKIHYLHSFQILEVQECVPADSGRKPRVGCLATVECRCAGSHRSSGHTGEPLHKETKDMECHNYVTGSCTTT